MKTVEQALRLYTCAASVVWGHVYNPTVHKVLYSLHGCNISPCPFIFSYLFIRRFIFPYVQKLTICSLLLQSGIVILVHLNFFIFFRLVFSCFVTNVVCAQVRIWLCQYCVCACVYVMNSFVHRLNIFEQNSSSFKIPLTAKAISRINCITSQLQCISVVCT